METYMTKEEKLDNILSSVDKDGNKLIYDKGKLYLKLITDQDRLRNIGKLNITDTTVNYIKYENESAKFQKTNAWSIIKQVVDHVDNIIYETDEKYYKISREDAIKYGQIFHFKSSTEVKLYVPINFWEIKDK